jgi:hypothetical protein
MVQEYEPSSGVLEIIVVQSEPLFAEYSILRLPLVPVDVQMMSCTDPASQFSPPLGLVRMISSLTGEE